MPNKKIVCLGGGALYFKDALADLAATTGLNGSEIVLYDIDIERAQLMAKCAQTLSDIAGANFKVHAVKDLTTAVDGADFAIGDIGGAGGGGGGYYSSGVHTNDLLISAKYGIFQIVGDTCGPSAMMSAFRSIPIYLNICHEMEKRCPNVIFINHANPMAILCRAMNKYSSLKNIIGICHGVQVGIRNIAEILDLPPAELDTTWIGTNHYYWFIEIYHKGKDVYPELKKRMALRKHPQHETLSAKLSSIYGYQIVYPADDHIIEFYPFLAQVKDAAQLPYGLAKIEEGGINIAKMYADSDKQAAVNQKSVTRETIIKDFTDQLDKTIKDFANAIKKSSSKDLSGSIENKMASIESTGKLIEAIAKGERYVHIVNIPNKSAVPNLPDIAVLEIEGVTNSHGIRSVYMGEAPLVLKGHLEKVIAWQEMVVDAGVKGDKNLALQALMLDPMAILPEKAEAMLDELLANSREFLPQFR